MGEGVKLTAANVETYHCHHIGMKLGLSTLRVFENRMLRRIFGPKM
jgi:hypothetical protein